MDLPPPDGVNGHTYSSSLSSAVNPSLSAGTPASSGSDPQLRQARKRSSWGQVQPGQDPLQLDTHLKQLASEPEDMTTLPTETPSSSRPLISHVNRYEDPFWTGPSTRPDYAAGGMARLPSYGSASSYASSEYTIPASMYGIPPLPPMSITGPSRMTRFATSQSSASAVSLISRDTDPDIRTDDEAELTQNMSGASRWSGVSAGSRMDSEHLGGTPASRRKSGRYSQSPLSRTGTRLQSMAGNMRRISLRVVNFAGKGMEDHVRLDEEDEKVDDEEPARVSRPDAPTAPPFRPLRGTTLGFLGPTNPLRMAMYRGLIFSWTEPIILCLIMASTTIFIIQAARPLPDVYSNPPVRGFFHQWEDYALSALFILFTLEAFARMSVSGVVLDPEVPLSALFSPQIITTANPTSSSTLTRQPSLTSGAPFSLTRVIRSLRDRLLQPFALQHRSAATEARTMPRVPSHTRLGNGSLSKSPMLEKLEHAHHHFRNPSHASYANEFMKSDTSRPMELPFKLSVLRGRETTLRNLPYLRHSWNRLDFFAILGFWVTFALATTGQEHAIGQHIGFFRALSVLRSARLLAITSGTTAIMKSLKTALPLLANVAYFVVFAIGMFSIIGLETFKGSLRRNCYLQPAFGEAEIQLEQPCGGHINATTLEPSGAINSDGDFGRIKGYICPLGQVCRVGDNPSGGTQSFDTIYNSVLQVMIVASANGWTPLMYSIIDSESFVSCLFFIVAVLVLNFWLINLFVAVITNTFGAIRSETKKSAFGAAPLSSKLVAGEEEEVEGFAIIRKANPVMQLYEHIRWCWVALALASLVLQATRTVDMSDTHKQVLDIGETTFTAVFAIEILVRLAAELPAWRNFFKKGTNNFDTVLAIACVVLQIPAVKDSASYPYLTAFQLARFYRVIMELPRMRPLMSKVFGNMYGLMNMFIFLLFMNALSALVSVQLLRPDLPASDTITFLNLFNAFLGVYQVFSSENWTDVLYGAMEAELPLGQTVLMAIYITIWMFFANFIVLQMFIAVINENFDVAEEAKKTVQANTYMSTSQPEKEKRPWIRMLNPYRWLRPNPKSVAVEHLPSNLVLPMQKALVDDYQLPTRTPARSSSIRSNRARTLTGRSLSALKAVFEGSSGHENISAKALRQHVRGESRTQNSLNPDDWDDNMEMLEIVRQDRPEDDDGLSEAILERRAKKADFIIQHPSYDKTFWIFSQKNPLRQLCQMLVRPSHGERIFGRPPSDIASPAFHLVIATTVIAGVVVEAYATPLYRRGFYLDKGIHRGAWFDIAESAFSLTLIVEFLIKVIADGFVFTPNAYVRSIWNLFDLAVLVGITINVTTTLIFIGGLSRITRSLKALRALRLITLIERMRKTFADLILSGITDIVDACLLAILYMIPYAVWGLNIFAGLVQACNDGSVDGKSDCQGEFASAGFGDDAAFSFLVPRVWDDPAPSTKFSFDNFRASLLILFEIVSLEGWTDVMGVATAIVGRDQQPQNNVSEVNAIFFLIYNLMGGVVILTLFVSIIISNFKTKTGSALLTQPQQEWIDLQKLIKRQQPSKRPKNKPTSKIRLWCFNRAVQKHGWWSRTMTLIFFFHLGALMLLMLPFIPLSHADLMIDRAQSYGNHPMLNAIRNFMFLATSLIYTFDTVVRFIGLGWRSFNASGWNIFDAIVSFGSLATTAISQVKDGVGNVMQQFQKLFMVLIAFKLVQRVDSLNKLFKTVRASIISLISLLGLWFILFLFFAIMYLEVFGLTKWDSAENHLQNYSSLGSAIVMLSFMTVGEGWNQYMHDYAIQYPRCTNSSELDPDSDCGSEGWSFTLFIAWNLLSMYIFVNMFTGVVVDSFSYVFQTTDGSKAITRAQMRNFKRVWARYANPSDGKLHQEALVPFLGGLNGIFEVRIYPMEHSVQNILASVHQSDHMSGEGSMPSHKVDRMRLNQVLSDVDYTAIRRRRKIYNRLYHEARMLIQYRRGITFTETLELLAHYKLIIDREALVLKDLVTRTEVNRLVTDQVHLDRVKSLMKMLSLRRRYQKERALARQRQKPDIPAIIVVESRPGSPVFPSTRDITSPRLVDGVFIEPDSPSPSPRHSMMTSRSPDTYSLDLSPSQLRRSSRRTSDISMLSANMADFSPRHSMVLEDEPAQLMTSMQNSQWGDLLAQAAEEEEE